MHTGWLKTGPSPLPTDSCLRNASFPSRKLARSSAVTDGSGSPYLPEVRSAVNVGPASATGEDDVPHPAVATQRTSAAQGEPIVRIRHGAIRFSVDRQPVHWQRPSVRGAMRR